MKIEIIAEIAQGYEGKPVLAELLTKGSIVAGADAIKFQLVYADELCIPQYPYYELFKSLEMPFEIWKEISDRIKMENRKLYFDIYGPDSLQAALKLNADGVKISATDFYNTDLIQEAVASFSQIFISCSGVPEEDLSLLINSVSERHKITLMHGFQAEPTETKDNHLLRISTLKKIFPEVQVGFMDHSGGASEEAFHLALIAMGQGVSCIEKHITLDYNLQIEDYISALSIDRFMKFVGIIRLLEPALGSPELSLIDKEIEYKKKAGKVAVARYPLKKGTIITKSDIVLKRISVLPVEGVFTRKEDVVGKELLSDISINSAIENSILK